MALNSLPAVDINSKNAELSEIKFKELFNENNNFICRVETPDFGCDYNVELIINGASATGWKFPVQLKSTQKLRVVDSKFISFSFETSRINYLMQSVPAMGMIVIYSVAENKCYYEFIDKIYGRLIEERDSDAWKTNNSVNIKIPLSNILTNDSVKDIHKVYVNRFQAAITMQNSHGTKYGLPTTDSTGDFVYDFNNVNHIKKYLKEYGSILINNYDIGTLYNSISKIPFNELIESKELLMIASIVYTESGRYTDSIHFASKLKNKFSLTEAEALTFSYNTLKNNYNLGYISNEEFLVEIESLLKNDTDLVNNVILRINIVRHKLIKRKAFEDFPGDLDKEIQFIFKDIEKLENESAKELYKIWNCENYSMILSEKLDHELIKHSHRKTDDNKQKVEWQKAISLIENKYRTLVGILNSMYEKAKKNNDKYLQAHVLSTLITIWLRRDISLLTNNKHSLLNKEEDEWLRKMFEHAVAATNLFVEVKMFKDAHFTVSNGIEIILLAEYLYDLDLSKDKEDLLTCKKTFEIDFDIPPYESSIKNLINILEKNKLNTNDELVGINFKDYTDNQIDNLSNLILQGSNLPKERLANIKNEIVAIRTFQLNCKNSNIVLRQAILSENENDKYKYPTVFVLWDKEKDIYSTGNSDINELLSEFVTNGN